MGGEGLGRHFGKNGNKPSWMDSRARADVISIGDVIIDRVIRTAEDDVDDVVAAWEDAGWFPSPGESVEVVPDAVPDDLADYAHETFPGGKAANQAVAAAESGAETSYLSRTGEAAAPILEEMAGRGLVTDYVEQADVVQGEAYVFVEENGDNRIACVKEEGGLTTSSYFDRAAEQIKVRDAEALLLTNAESDALLDAVFDLLEGDGPTVIFDPSPIDGAEKYLEREVVDYATPNEVEYEALQDALEESTATVIQTHAGGATVDDRYTVHAPDLEEMGYDVVDTTGAGDTFNGYLAGGLARGMDEMDAVAYAVNAASLSVTRHGAQSGIPGKKEVQALMADR